MRVYKPRKKCLWHRKMLTTINCFSWFKYYSYYFHSLVDTKSLSNQPIPLLPTMVDPSEGQPPQDKKASLSALCKTLWTNLASHPPPELSNYHWILHNFAQQHNNHHLQHHLQQQLYVSPPPIYQPMHLLPNFQNVNLLQNPSKLNNGRKNHPQNCPPPKTLPPVPGASLSHQHLSHCIATNRNSRTNTSTRTSTSCINCIISIPWWKQKEYETNNGVAAPRQSCPPSVINTTMAFSPPFVNYCLHQSTPANNLSSISIKRRQNSVQRWWND